MDHDRLRLCSASTTSPSLFLLNLAFSTQAAYAAPLILLAQNRQAERDRLRSEEDRLVNQRTQAEAEFLARELAASRLSLGKIEATLARVEERSSATRSARRERRAASGRADVSVAQTDERRRAPAPTPLPPA